MENEIRINGKLYGLAIGYKENEKLRHSLNSLTEKTYGFHFEEWYQNGYWTDRYIPYSIVEGDRILANVSVNLMDILIDNTVLKGIQLGTVMTDEAYRKQGLSRGLLEMILEEYNNNCDFLYLFANSTVLDFYPKFGFQKMEESQYSRKVKAVKEKEAVKKLAVIKLDITNETHRDLLTKKILHPFPISSVSMINNPGLLLFYCTGFLKNNLYYFPDLDAIVVAEYEKDVLYLLDIFCTGHLDSWEAAESLITEETKEVILGFVPKENPDSYEKRRKSGDTLFIKAKGFLPFSKDLVFPELSHA
jgi:Predicted acyltransferase